MLFRSTQKTLLDILTRAHDHKGTSLIEILQNCIVYNDEVFEDVLNRKTAADRQIHVEHGKPLIFGADKNKGLRLNPQNLSLEVVTIGEDGVSEADIVIHDETNRILATLLAQMSGEEFPTAFGVLYCNPADTYEQGVGEQMSKAQTSSAKPSLDDVLREGHIWEVK